MKLLDNGSSWCAAAPLPGSQFQADSEVGFPPPVVLTNSITWSSVGVFDFIRGVNVKVNRESYNEGDRMQNYILKVTFAFV